MELRKGESRIVATEKYGDVKIRNFNDKELHFEWEDMGHKERGFINVESGVMSNVSQTLVEQTLEAM